MEETRYRINMNINREWKFIHGDIIEAKEPFYNDSSWYDIGLPHSFSIPYFSEKESYVGYGWYRKYLNVLSEWKGKKYSYNLKLLFNMQRYS